MPRYWSDVGGGTFRSPCYFRNHRAFLTTGPIFKIPMALHSFPEELSQPYFIDLGEADDVTGQTKYELWYCLQHVQYFMWSKFGYKDKFNESHRYIIVHRSHEQLLFDIKLYCLIGYQMMSWCQALADPWTCVWGGGATHTGAKPRVPPNPVFSSDLGHLFFVTALTRWIFFK